ncbi:MAG: MATE family efflux transporter [Lachnospiraceae bacterium]|nr:MATE family efflux transporter [Lachnospiraceae bacterium]
MNRDLTVGRPETVLWKFTLPLLGSVLFQQMYNIADSLIAGKFVGEQALAAVGNAYEITLVYLAFAVGCNIASSVIVARLFGAKDYSRMKTAIGTGVTVSAVLCGILMLLGFLLMPKLLVLINTPAKIFDGTLLYMNIYTGGLFFLFFYNLLTGIFSAMGDSRTPFIFLAFSSSANVVLDYFFVTGFEMGVSGVAWATFICQGVSCILVIITMIRRLRKIDSGGKVVIFSGRMFRDFVRIAVPSTLQQLSVSVGNIFIQSIVNSLGTGVVAGYSAAVKLNNLTVTTFFTIGNGMSNFTSQNLGAKKPERIGSGYKGGMKMAAVIYIPVFILFFFFGATFINLFLKAGSSEEALSVGVSVDAPGVSAVGCFSASGTSPAG